MDAESQYTDELNHRIESLKNLLVALSESKVKVIAEKDAEIERLKTEITNYVEENAHFAWRDQGKNKLITELCDALDRCDPIHISIQEVADLIGRGRKAVEVK